MRIQKLPAEVRSKLQSGVIITDAVQCVLELVHNSLDAGATGIAVRIDLKAYQIRVIDNGKGIEKDDLEFVGERFMTSKYHSPNEMETSFSTYGYRGQSLSSLQEVSRSLTIETKSEEGGPTLVKVFKNNKALPITESNTARSGIGTTVTVDDFMYTMPVRRKRISEVFDMEEIKSQLQHLAIINYKVCFTLRNENKGLILLQTPQASSLLESISNIYGKKVAKSLKSLKYEEKKYEVTGLISVKPQVLHNLQLIYINKKIITKGVIHKFVNSLIKEYFGKKTLLSDSPTGQVLNQLKTSNNIFIIQIKCPNSHYELFTNLRKVTVEFKNWKDVLKCIHRAIKRTFKDALNLDSSINNQHQEVKNEAKKAKVKGAFGTSLLVNAVRGAPVKRSPKRQSARNKKRVKLDHKKESETLLSKINKALDDRKFVNNMSSNICQSECTNDSLESPIPRKAWKCIKQNYNAKFTKMNCNQSFVDFYEWLKVKFETDTNAFNLYNDFLQFKNKTSHPPDVLQFKSPVLGVKPKRKQISNSKKNTPKKKSKTVTGLSSFDIEMEVGTERQLEICTNKHLAIETVQVPEEMESGNHETFSLSVINNENLNFDGHRSQLFKIQENCSDLQILHGNVNTSECNLTSMSLPSSDVQFANIIKFRNLSESFFRSTYNAHSKAITNETSHSWVSHYQNIPKDLELHRKKLSTENLAFSTSRARRKKNFEIKISRANVNDFTKRANVCDVEVQVSMPNQNAVVQTNLQVPESPSFESHEESGLIASESHNLAFEEEQQKQKKTAEEMPNIDSWNTAEPMQLETNTLFSKDIMSNEFVCGHKSQASTKVNNTSKDIQTFSALWTESLSKMECPPGDSARIILENSQMSQPTTVSKTIPIEEIECNIAQQTESEFCVTERHDFVPKGLSPKLLNAEAAKVSSLSPQKQCEIKLAINYPQNELLENIKWQSESTGDYLKPTIPEGIIFELRRKAGENVMSCENPVLSATLSYCAIKIHNLLHSFTFTKELLSSVEVLGQLDKKFIVTKMKISTPKKMELISLFDQHAVDERIKLEELINENISPEGRFLSTRLNPPIECELTEFDVGVVSELKKKMFNFGLEVEPVNENSLCVSEVPTFLLKKHENDLKNKKEISLSDAVRDLISNIVKEMKETRGAVSRIPKIMHNAFCLDACHSKHQVFIWRVDHTLEVTVVIFFDDFLAEAIRFNRQLSVEIMVEMINKLQNCKLPFQCAHGRPSVIPIIDLEDFKPSMDSNVDFQKIMRFYNKRREDAGNSEFV